jgi:hypothetical protein
MLKVYIKKTALVVAILIGIVSQSSASKNYWNDITVSAAKKTATTNIVFPEKFRSLSLNYEVLKSALLTAPIADFYIAKGANSVNIDIPMPYGSFETFKVLETPMMEEELANKYSEIKTYTGVSIQNPHNIVKIDIGPYGFHAMVLSKDGRYFINPISNNTTTEYMSFYRRDLPSWANTFNCSTVADEQFIQDSKTRVNEYYARGGATSVAVQLRTYRLALGCTPEYATAATGLASPTKAQTLAKMVISMNRVNGVYETDVAVHMNLVAKTDTLIYLTGSPYSNSNVSAMLSQNQTACNARIGSANYDIGHVFSTGGGGIAGLGVVCTSSKAQGVTGSPSPVADAFDIDYVAHEMGHQFAGNHTFNSITSSCGGGNRNASTAYEPGSGTTIMAYAGICGADDIALHSDPYFHSISLDEINAFIGTGSGNSCPVKTVTGNNPPVVSAGSNFTIPISTPFTLTGSATDPDGDELTYSWEEMDLGTGGAPNSATGNAPLFRFFPPKSIPSRTFPKLNDILTNVPVKGERLPSYARSMKFRLTARDNKVMAGATGKSEMIVTVSAAAGPFTITSFNVVDTAYVGSSETITWNVNNTNLSPVNCSLVRILLSTDAGQTFPIILKDSTNNDGSEAVIIPNNISNTCRIKIEAIGNIFLDINNAALRILAPSAPDFSVAAVNTTSSGVCLPDTAKFNVTFNAILGFNNPITISASNVPVGASVTYDKATALPGDVIVAKVTTLGLTAGTKNINFVGTSGSTVRSTPTSFVILTPVTAGTTFTAPANGQLNVNPNTPFTWTSVVSASAYHLQIASDSNFTSIVFDTVIIGNGSTSYLPIGLPLGTKLYTHINALNNCGAGPVSAFISFTTVSLPAAPTNLIKLSQTATSATIKWTDNANNESGFRVERSINNDTTFTEISTNLGSNTTLFVSPNLIAGNTYYYRVRAINAIGFSPYSNVLQIVFATGINQTSAFNSLEIFPNPSANVFNIQLQDEYNGITEISVLDEMGRVLSTQNVLKDKAELAHQIDLSIYSNGVYFLKIQSDKKTTTKRIIKLN